ncbi:MAG: prepilin-type N-terminal cleavage/methylation domain-containing protein [Burkholderiales bacterium]|nr:prepilin-type N-terminal cleavage/methylation domain-containing protein [Burkholderiales bacterium]
MPGHRFAPRSAPALRLAGFTLIELLIVIVVLGFLTAIAVPQYTEFVRRSRIVDATSAMNDFRVRMEQFYQDNRSYANAGACGVDPASAGSTAFTMTCAGPSATGYTLDATGNAAQGMSGFQYRLVVAAGGVTRSTVGVPASWTPLPSPNTCWQVRKGGYCQ